MEIKKAFQKDGLLSISYEDKGTIINIKSSDSPKQAFNDATEKLKVILYRNLEVFTPEKVDEVFTENESYKDIKRAVAKQERARMVAHFKAIGLSHSFSEQNGDSYRILGIYETSSGSNPISTCAMTVPPQGDSFWEGNLPNEYPKYLTPDDVAAINEFLFCVKDFLNGEREQKELFTEEGQPTEEASNEAEEFTEEGEVIDFNTEEEA